MSDPRKEPGFKQKRNEDKVVLLLGAILDALTTSLPSVKAQTPATPSALLSNSRRTSKAD